MPGEASILPAGTLTFLFAHIERPTALTDKLIDSTLVAHGGLQPEDHSGGEGVVGVFGSAADGVAAALDVQRALTDERVRIGLHTGDARLRGDRYYTGAAVHRCAQLCDAGHGGQTLLSSVTASLVTHALPAGCELGDLGVHRLRDLAPPERVFELRHPDLARDSPPLRSLDPLTNNLPVQLTSFVGRRDELAAVKQLLAGERLLTLTGSGGSGKTRLALQAAAEQAGRWPDGVWWVELASVSEPTLVAELAAAATGVLVEPVGGPLRALAVQLRDRRMLVCLDNCEHVLDASAEVAEELLRSCPEVSVLATSREPLGVASETVWRVPPLVEDEAVTLFAERASRVRPWFTLDATNEAAVRTMCRRLDGIPLAVELAAAWLSTLTPAQIAAGLDDRFALLVRGPRGVSRRQQTLAASIDWSHDLLDDTDRAVFRRLAVFSGGFTLDAARTACTAEVVGPDDVLDSLGRLVDKSLVVAEEREGEARFRLLETIRQYADERLHEADDSRAARDRHLDHYLAFAEAVEPELENADQDTWLARLETEHENFRAALDWGLAAAEPERGRRLAAALAFFWNLHGHNHEGVEYLQRAIALAPDDRSILAAKLWTGVAVVADTGGPLHLELEAAQRGLEIATANGDERNRGRCLLLAASVQFYVDYASAEELRCLAGRCAEAAGDSMFADYAFTLEGVLLASRDRHAAARPILEEGLKRCRRRGDRIFSSMTLGYLVDGAMRTGHVRRAVELAAESLRIAEPLGDYYALGGSTGHLALVTGLAGDIDGGLRLMDRIVRSVEGSEHDILVPRMASVMGLLCLWRGDCDDAVRWFERDALSKDPMTESLIVARALPGYVAALRGVGRLDTARHAVDRATALARKLDVPHLLAFALEQAAFLAADEDADRAEDLHHQALAVRVDHGLRTYCVDSLDALASLAARAESFGEAVRLIAASDAARGEMGYPRRPVDEPGHEALLAMLRAALSPGDFAAAWAEGAALALDDAVAYVRRARGTRGRPSTGWASLTPTELDVVRLVVEGLSNPDIGTRLLMSRGTVKTHLSHVYAKLGIANRTELASLASTHLAKNGNSTH